MKMTIPQKNNELVRWLFLDLNSYFASIEQELRPELRGKPVGVVPVMAETTCCIASSYEAKAYGVKTGTMVSDARRLCPGIQLIEARHQLYVEYHHKIVGAIESCLPVSAVMSVDEMACRLMGQEQTVARAVEIAHNMKRVLRDKVGKTLRCSIGLAPNRFLAKVGSDMQKPDGLVVIRPCDLPQILYSLQLQDIPGIGYRLHKRVLQHGVQTVEQLCALSKTEMKKIWNGIVGERIWYWLRGDDIPPELTHRHTIGHSHVLPPEFKTKEGTYAVAQKLLHKAGARLRKMRYWASGLSLFVRFGRERTWSEKISTVECQDTLTLLEALETLWKQYPATRGNPTAVGITLFDLIPEHLHTLNLFEDLKRARLAAAIDRINYKFGTDTVYFGGMINAKNAAPTRIAFTSIPDYF
jgi:DNA polymerase-4